jgi:hypothetical protein
MADLSLFKKNLLKYKQLFENPSKEAIGLKNSSEAKVNRTKESTIKKVKNVEKKKLTYFVV